MENYDVIVVGAGPGGSTAAAYLGRSGFNVLLLDKAKFPRDKICGDAVSGKSMNVIKEFALEEEIQKDARHGNIYGVIFSGTDGKTVEIPFAAAKDKGRPPGYTLPRIATDNILFQNAKKYAKVKEGFAMSDVIFENGYAVGVKGRDMAEGKEMEFRAKVVVGADGAGSIVANKAGVGALAPEHACIAIRAYYEGISGMTDNIEIHFVKEAMPGYFWIFPIGEGKANVGLGILMKDVQEKKMNLPALLERIVAQNANFAPRFANAKKVSSVQSWTLPFGSKIRKAHGNGWILVGDAASLIDPFSGEGVGNATASAKIAAKIIAGALKENNFSESYFAQYQSEMEAALKPELQTSYMLQKLGRQEWLLNFIIGKAHKSEKVRETLSAMLGSEEAKKEFASPVFYLKMLFA
ncbi:NAD(P)/FAD-dependent oxidoreductase [Candidatus Micrarchaeota archaeon]|nr:NAD(P)/FAD-dependent oxidoreductase [Candidatus Micrarchaeota archaeon]